MGKKSSDKIQNKKPYFDSVDPRMNFPEMEKKLLDDWYKKGVVKKYLQKNNSSKKYFSFLDGPITANNPMGVHHAWGRTYKDLWQRYKNMQGFRQRFQNGFDCQGLWVEVEVEKELGFKNKKDIENYGVDKFVQKCKERVIKYADIQAEQSKRLGYFMDWDNSYFTMSDENNYMIWHFLKVCHENGWLYKGRDSVPWCPRCETAISQHEMLTEDYKEVVHDSIYFTLPIKETVEHLLVWTTTPWTLPANIAVAVDKDLVYSLVKHNGYKYWIAKESADRVLGAGKYETLKSVKGSKLEGLKYSGPFDDLPAVKEVSEKSSELHTVILTDSLIMPITTTEGTGMVHTAVSAGTEDFRLGKKLDLPMIPVIEDNASYFKSFGQFSGKNAKKHPELILDFLKKENNKPGSHWVYKIEKYKHRYPNCWRCKAELVWKVTDEWYISMDVPSIELKTQNSKLKKNKRTLRQRMIRVAKKIEWIPEFGLKRELDWLNNMQDWLISKKNRYWGLALPIWECGKCKHFEVVGSKEELKKKAVEGWNEFKGKSPHKPQIDKVKIKCPKCKGDMSRIEPVGSPWLDAGIVAYSTVAKNNRGKPLYLQDKKQWSKWIPADFLTESFPGQFKNWFYSLIAMSTVLEDLEPTKKVLGFATLFAENGAPMHKSAGNMIEFNEGADKIGVDVMRWMYVRQNVADNLLFGYKIADETRRRFHLKLWNIYSFFVTYANLNEWRPKKIGKIEMDKLPLLDHWIMARFGETAAFVTDALDKYDATTASSQIDNFVQDFSTWYIRRSRDRVGVNAKDAKDKDRCYTIMWLMLTNLSKILAPFNPFISDEIFRNLTKFISVHLLDWPTRDQMGMFCSSSIIYKGFMEDMDLIRAIAEKGHAQRKEKQIPVRQPLQKIFIEYSKEIKKDELLKLLKDELNIKEVKWKKGKELNITLNTKITPKLKQEAKARELIRNIQKERKKMGLNLAQKTNVTSTWIPKDKKLVEWILKKTSTVKLIQSKEFKVTKASN